MDLVAAQSEWIFGYSLASMLLADKKDALRGRTRNFFLSDFAPSWERLQLRGMWILLAKGMTPASRFCIVLIPICFHPPFA